MKALLVNTPLHIRQDIQVYETLERIKISLQKFQWSVFTHTAQTGKELEDFILDSKPDVAFCYDYCAEDGANLRAVCEKCNIPEVFSTTEILELFLNKAKTKLLAKQHGFDVIPDYVIYPNNELPNDIDIEAPYFVKPLLGGDSRGIYNKNVFQNFDQIKTKYVEIIRNENTPYIIEKFINNENSLEKAIFSVFTSNGWLHAPLVYSYDIPKNQQYKYLSKTVKDKSTEHNLKIKIDYNFDMSLLKQLDEFYNKIGAYGTLRAEFICIDNANYLIEINGIPGINVCFNLTAEYNDMSIEELTHEMFKGAKI